MFAELKNIFADGFSSQALVDALTYIVGKILGFVAEEEGYDFPAADETTGA